MLVLILILLEVTQIIMRLNNGESLENVLILILLEVTQIDYSAGIPLFYFCLNPYSTGSNSNIYRKQRRTAHF